MRVKGTESKDWVREGNLGHIRSFVTLLNCLQKCVVRIERTALN